MDEAQLIDDATRICATAAPTFAEGARAALVRSMFEASGLRAIIDDAGNVVCRLGPDDAPAAVFAAHLDTVFAADTAIEIRHDTAAGTIHAPGIGDNSLGVAALLAIAARLRDAAPVRPVVLAATVGEEGLGDLRGAKHLLETVECSAFVAVEGGMLDTIVVGGVGSTRLRVRYRGPGGHSWSDRGTPSAVHGLITAAARLLATPAPAELALNVGRLGGGTSINTIAAEATLELDLRAESEELLERAAATARATFAAAPEGLEAAVETIGERPSGALPPRHPLLEAARAARRTAGLPPASEVSSSTDANAAYGRGIPAVTVGLTIGHNAHRLDEYVELAPLPRGLRALQELVRTVTGLDART